MKIAYSQQPTVFITSMLRTVTSTKSKRQLDYVRVVETDEILAMLKKCSAVKNIALVLL